jgi:hypothetical protein
MKYVSVLWPPLEAALAIFNAIVSVKNTVFGKELTKTKKTATKADSISFLNPPSLSLSLSLIYIYE